MSLFGLRESHLYPRGFYLLHGNLGATASDPCHRTKRHEEDEVLGLVVRPNNQKR